jgi:hypothetical protein
MVRGIAAAAAGPAAIVVLLEAAVLLGAAVGHHPWWPDLDLNLSEAAAVRDHAEVARLLERGEDPNARRPVRAGLLGNDDVVEATPLEAAVSIRRAELMDVLFTAGAALAPGDWGRLRCWAEAHEYDDVVARLDMHRPASAGAVECHGEENLW